MKATSALAAEYIRELESEVRSTKECLAAIPMDNPDYKPHEKSMALGYMAILVADIPRWIQYAIEKGEVDFATYPQASQGRDRGRAGSAFRKVGRGREKRPRRGFG
jgi:hypothetical protein